MNPVVLIPAHRETLTSDEEASLRQCRRVLGHYDCRVLVPEGLALPEAFAGLKPVPFPSTRFSSIQNYSRLLLSAEFYDRFQEHDFMLICHLDAWVFRDELATWCAREFDYIGAPWGDAAFLHEPPWRKQIPAAARFPRLARLLYGQDFRVGNGGFSLRRISGFQRVLRHHAAEAGRWSTNEDMFWSIWGARLDARFRIAPETQAMRFALELEPRRYVRRMHGRLPFGCHAWKKYDPDFWASHIVVANDVIP